MQVIMYIGMDEIMLKFLKKSSWKKYSKEFQRTYSKISNLDDMHENGT